MSIVDGHNKVWLGNKTIEPTDWRWIKNEVETIRMQNSVAQQELLHMIFCNFKKGCVYYRPLEEDLRSDTSGTFKRMMVSLCCANRDESMMVDHQAAAADAQALLSAGELRLGTDESAFNAILCQRNYAQLGLIFQEYEKLSGTDIEQTIKGEFSGDSEEGFLAIIRAIKDQPTFFARQLHHAVSGMGTDDRKLVRNIITRCEIDMEEIKRAYEAKYGESLGEAIKDDASGDYKKCLLALIGEY